MLLSSKHVVLFTFLLLLCSVQDIHCHFLMKAMLHGAAMGMMMRPRFLPIPIPLSRNMLTGFTDIMSGFRRQFDSPRVLVLQQQERQPKQKIIIIQNQEECCNWE